MTCWSLRKGTHCPLGLSSASGGALAAEIWNGESLGQPDTDTTGVHPKRRGLGLSRPQSLLEGYGVLPRWRSNRTAMWQKLYALRFGYAAHSRIPRASCAALAADAEISTSRHIQASVDLRSDKDTAGRERCRRRRSSPISQAETLKMVRFQLSLAAIFSIEKNAP
ncbi:hypothetical protein AOQ84DRAFT_14939 [Glonium stellatum]|uniref:Uncharacterized protein n=1 Tax=Glonium stellatum TaxID=574774 RepID=A0A8E2JUJ1_9PEZI|nr:hypothetical protein AOQ84DRAFT_14939 [Glonium stellatum]